MAYAFSSLSPSSVDPDPEESPSLEPPLESPLEPLPPVDEDEPSL